MADYKITADELRQKFLKFFEDKGHAIIPSASLIPENDPTVLFTTAGMHPLVPYLQGAKHPAGTRLTDVQKCIRTADIEDVGDASHLTFFEMLGNWSLGDYFKKEAIAYSWEFLTSPKYLGLDPDRLAFSVFAGEEGIPRDEESAGYWKECGVKEDHIFFLPRENNWWGLAGGGPCGPDSEMFIITDKEPCGPDCSPACSCGRYLEIWNDVFMQYNKKEDGTLEPLARPNVDTGMGLERTIGVLQGVKTVYETDLLFPIIECIGSLCGHHYGENDAVTKAMRVVCDHIRSSTFILGDPLGITPSNVDKGYILRRLIRRAIRYGAQIDLPEGAYSKIAEFIVEKYKSVYPELEQNKAFIVDELNKEEERFRKALVNGLKEFDKVIANLQKAPMQITVIGGKQAFRLYDTFGFPLEMTQELAAERGFTVDVDGFHESFKKHQELSHSGAEQRFAGGLADKSDATAHLHTATHLLNAGLRKFVDPGIQQRGSNITSERLRFDFNFSRPLTAEEIKTLEDYVNGAIAAGVDVICEEMTVEEAKSKGAIGIFTNKYGDRVKVYTVPGYCSEICGGPHAKNTADLGHFVIQKEQSSSAGVRRIRAILE